MQDLIAIVHNQVLVTALVACFLAQFLKLVVEVVRHQKLNFHVLVETGGMPSSHSALVTALATGVGQTIGWGSTEFAVSTIFAIIVMYDAAGVRWAAGQQARILNQILAGQASSQDPEEQVEHLKELLGHTPIQVFVGSVVGVAVSLLSGVAFAVS
jgi:uncharacterized protein